MTKWLIALAILFVVGSLLSGIIEQQYLGSSQVGVLHGLIGGYEQVDFSNPLIGIGSLLSIVWNSFKALWNMFWWNYAFFDGEWVIIKYALFWPISFGMVITLVLSLTRGISTTA
jgi:hypothetical protein